MERKIITAKIISGMFPDSLDALPSPAEHDGRRKRWVGIGWVDEGKADGSEPLVIVDA